MKKIYLFLLIFTLTTSSWAQNFAVGNTTITFNDPSRSGGFGSGGGPGRQIQTEIYYPANAAGANVPLANGTFPVIVFGHGFAMSWDAYANVWTAFASRGYIIAFPRTEGGLLPAPSHNNFGLDLAIVEVKLQALNMNSSSIFYQKVKNTSAIMGHSMGGGATFLGAANNTSPTLKAVVGLAPAETNPSAIAAAANVSVDALILSGSSDGVTPPAGNHQPIYNNLPSSCKTFLSITNGSHCYFANTNFNCDFGELTTGAGSLPRAAQQDITADYVGLWLDFKLKGSCLAWDEFLDSLAVSSRVVEQQSCSYGYLQPNVSLSGNTSFCAGSSINLTATLNNAYTYTWYQNSQVLGASNNTLNAQSSGAYQVVASNSLGCKDSSNILNLSTLPSYNIYDTSFACTGSTFIFPDGSTCNNDSTHISAFTSSLNCDSNLITTVFFGSSVMGSYNEVLCWGSSSIYNGITFTSDTIFMDTLYNGSSYGCDSITQVSLTWLEEIIVNESAAICLGENYLLPNGLFENQAGLYTFSYVSAMGCDSTYALDLIVGTPVEILDTTIQFISTDTLWVYFTTNVPSDSIVWMDYVFDYLYSVGDTAYFYADEPGVEGFIATFYNGGCATFLDYIIATSIQTRNELPNIHIYPNPVRDYIFWEDNDITELEIFNTLGQQVGKFDSTGKKFLLLDFISKGTYILKTNKGFSLFVKI